jgi:uncharacterized protein (TIGR02996 family)
MEDELLAAIVAAPDDDRPRLVYADWLVERGDPRGELIRVQCELARIEATDEGVARVRRLQSRQSALLKAHEAEWTAGLPSTATYLHRRGLVELVRANDPSDFGAARARAPLVRALHTSRPDPLRLENEQAIEELTLEDQGLVKIAAVACLPKLRRLTLPEKGLVSDALAAAVSPRPLEELALGIHTWAASAADRTGPPLVGLEELALEHSEIMADDVLHLATVLPRLSSLDVAANYGHNGLARLDLCSLLEALPALRRLRLSKMKVTDAQVAQLAASPLGARLVRLDLARNEIGDAGALAIARSEHLRGLRRLNLNANPISNAVKKTVVAAFPDALVQVR